MNNLINLVNISKQLESNIDKSKSVCYDNNIIESSENMKEKYITTAYDLSKYIIAKYNIDYKKDISPIKLQKSLYFCFAYYGGFIAKSKDSELNTSLTEYLFPEEFHAWVYGPVIPEIFRIFKDIGIDGDMNIPEIINNDTVKDTIDSLLDDLFKINDFKLVSLSHEDKVWIDNFDEKNPKANKIINRKDIIDEYVLKVI